MPPHPLAGLRIFGDKLEPKKISRLLGGVPTNCFRKGDVKKWKSKGVIRKAVKKTGGWILWATVRETENLDAQVDEILGKLTQDLNVWASLSKEYWIDLSCGFWMKESTEDIRVSAKTLKTLAERGIKFELCIYAPLEDVKADDPCPCNSGKKHTECCALKIVAKK